MATIGDIISAKKAADAQATSAQATAKAADQAFSDAQAAQAAADATLKADLTQTGPVYVNVPNGIEVWMPSDQPSGFLVVTPSPDSTPLANPSPDPTPAVTPSPDPTPAN